MSAVPRLHSPVCSLLSAVVCILLPAGRHYLSAVAVAAEVEEQLENTLVEHTLEAWEGCKKTRQWILFRLNEESNGYDLTSHDSE